MEKYLSMPKEGAEIIEISDLGVANDDLPKAELAISDVTVVGALLHSYYACVACGGKVEQASNNLYKCTKCHLEQLLQSCGSHVSSTLHLSSGSQYFNLTAFKNVLASTYYSSQLYNQPA